MVLLSEFIVSHLLSETTRQNDGNELEDADSDADSGSDASLALDSVHEFGQAAVSVNVLGPIASSALATVLGLSLATRVWHPVVLACDHF